MDCGIIRMHSTFCAYEYMCDIVSLWFSALVKNHFGGSDVCHRIFPLSHFLEKHKRRSLKATLQRGDQEAGFGACWRSYPALQVCTALQTLLRLCGLSGYGPGWECADWPCSEWTPTVPCSNKKRGIFRDECEIHWITGLARWSFGFVNADSSLRWLVSVEGKLTV